MQIYRSISYRTSHVEYLHILKTSDFFSFFAENSENSAKILKTHEPKSSTTTTTTTSILDSSIDLNYQVHQYLAQVLILISKYINTWLKYSSKFPSTNAIQNMRNTWEFSFVLELSSTYMDLVTWRLEGYYYHI